jgi:hypothetical protein
MLRSYLAAQLYSYKKHLVRVDRDGGWASFLRERNISLSTADRYVKQHEVSLTPAVGKLLPEEFKEPTKEEVSKLVKKLEPKLRSVLTTADPVTQFMAELEVALSRSASEQPWPAYARVGPWACVLFSHDASRRHKSRTFLRPSSFRGTTPESIAAFIAELAAALRKRVNYSDFLGNRQSCAK